MRPSRMMELIRGLFDTYHPLLVVYEDYVYFGDRLVSNIDISSGFKVHEIIGAIKMACLEPPYPELVKLLPQSWGCTLTGSQAHTKAGIARAVSLRLGSQYHATDGAHHTDSIGLGIVGLDAWQHRQRVKASDRRTL